MLAVVIAILIMWVSAVWLYAFYGHAPKNDSRTPDSLQEDVRDEKKSKSIVLTKRSLRVSQSDNISGSVSDGSANKSSHSKDLFIPRKLSEKSFGNERNGRFDVSPASIFDPPPDEVSSCRESCSINNICGTEDERVWALGPGPKEQRRFMRQGMPLSSGEAYNFCRDLSGFDSSSKYHEINQDCEMILAKGHHADFSSTFKVPSLNDKFGEGSRSRDYSPSPKNARKLIRSDLSSGGHLSEPSTNSPSFTPPTLPSSPTLRKRGPKESLPLTNILPVKSPLDSVILRNRLALTHWKPREATEIKVEKCCEKVFNQFQCTRDGNNTLYTAGDRRENALEEVREKHTLIPEKLGTGVTASSTVQDSFFTRSFIEPCAATHSLISWNDKCKYICNSTEPIVVISAPGIVENNINTMSWTGTESNAPPPSENFEDFAPDRDAVCDDHCVGNNMRNNSDIIYSQSDACFFLTNDGNEAEKIRAGNFAESNPSKSTKLRDLQLNYEAYQLSKVQRPSTLLLFKSLSSDTLGSPKMLHHKFSQQPPMKKWSMIHHPLKNTSPTSASSTCTLSSNDCHSSVSSITKLILTSTSTQLTETPSTPPSPPHGTSGRYSSLPDAGRPTINVISPEMSRSHHSSSASFYTSESSSSSSSSHDTDTQDAQFFFRSSSLEDTRIFNVPVIADEAELPPTFTEPMSSPNVFTSWNVPFDKQCTVTNFTDNISNGDLNRTICDLSETYFCRNFPSNSILRQNTLIWSGQTLESVACSESSSLDVVNYSFKPINFRSIRYIDNSSQGSFRSYQSSIGPESFISLGGSADKISLPPSPSVGISSAECTFPRSGSATPLPSTNDGDRFTEDLGIYLSRYGLSEINDTPSEKTVGGVNLEVSKKNVANGCSGDNLSEKGTEGVNDSFSNSENISVQSAIENDNTIRTKTRYEDSSRHPVIEGNQATNSSEFELEKSPRPITDKETFRVFNNSDVHLHVLHCDDASNAPSTNTSDDTANDVHNYRKTKTSSKREILLQKRRRLISRLREQDIEQVLQLYFFSDPSTMSLSPLCSPLCSPMASAPGSPSMCTRTHAPTIFGTVAGDQTPRDTTKRGLPQTPKAGTPRGGYGGLEGGSAPEWATLPDDDNSLVYEDGVLVSGSLQALVQHATPTSSYYPDTAYLFAFLLSSRLFIKPHDLLQRICDLGFTQQGLQDDDVSAVDKEKLEKFVLHIVQLLGEWSETFPYDFRDERVMSCVRTMTHRCIALQPTLRRDVTQILHNLLNKLTHLERYEESLAKHTVSPPADSLSEVPDITDVCGSPLVMAQQLTHIELERLSFIGPEEFVQAFAKESNIDSSYKDLKKTNNLEVYVQWFNKLSYLVATQAVSHVKKKQRVRVIEWWIEVARECFNIGNFNSLMGIIAGLNMSPVSRLKKTWSKVQTAKFSVLEHQMDPTSNFSSYRSTLKAAMWRSAGAVDDRQKIVIPFFSLLVKDLYFLNEGCANRLPNSYINFDKFWQLAKQVTEFMAWKQVTCPFERAPHVINYLQSASVLSETGLALSSFECEGPDNSYEKERYKNLHRSESQPSSS